MSKDFENIVIPDALVKHLAQVHKIHRLEICQCFENACGRYLSDKTDQPSSGPQIIWFIAETNRCREIKIGFVLVDTCFHIRYAFEPNREDRQCFSGDQN